MARAPAWSFRTSPPLSTGWVSFVPSDQCVLRCQGICVFPLTKQSCTFSSFQPQGPPCGVWRIASRHGECELIVAMDSELEGPPEALRPSISKGCSRKKEKKNFFFLRFEVQIKMRNASVSIEKEVYLPKDLSEKRTCWCAPRCSRHGMQRAALPTCV